MYILAKNFNRFAKNRCSSSLLSEVHFGRLLGHVL